MDKLSFRQTRAVLLLCAYHSERQEITTPDLLQEDADEISEGYYNLSQCSFRFREIALQHLTSSGYLFGFKGQDSHLDSTRKHLVTEKMVLLMEKFLESTNYVFPISQVKKEKRGYVRRATWAYEFLSDLDLEAFDCHFKLES